MKSHPVLKCLKSIFLLLSIYFSMIIYPCFAQNVGSRQKERNTERWSMSTYFTERAKLKQSDFLIRFYSDGSGKNRPRIEPFTYGLWYNGLQSDGSTWEGVGYGGNIYFNNFISGIFKIPTPNIVPGVFGEHREEMNRNISRIDSYGPSLRLFGRNQQDSALFINLKNTQRDLQGQYYEEWNWETAAVIYIAQNIRFEGSWLFSNDDWPAFSSNYAKQNGFKLGGGIEIGFFRVSAFFEKNSFTIKNPNYTINPNALKSFDELRRVIQIGISI